jgi:hypothetical protein
VKKSGLGFGTTFAATFVIVQSAVIGLAYKAETDASIASIVDQIPGGNYIMDPARQLVAKGILGREYKPTKVDVLDAPSKESEVAKPVEEPVHVQIQPVEEEKPAAEEPEVAKVEEASPSEEQPARAEPEAEPASPGEEAAIAAEQHVAAIHAAAASTIHAAASKHDEPAPAVTNSKPHVSLKGLSPDEIARLTDSKVLKQALADSAREYIALRRDVEATLLKDVHQLNEHDLRIRIKQLATEMFERLAWEDLRMTQSLKGVQAELTEKYTDLMHRQHHQLELEIARILFAYEQDTAHQAASKLKEVEASYQKQLEDTVRAQAEGFHNTLKRELEEQATKIQTELQDELNHQVALLRKSQVDELMAMQPRVLDLQGQLEGIKRAADATAGAIKKTIDIHHLSAAVLSLELALSTPTSMQDGANSIGQHFEAVKAACQGDEVVTEVLKSLPARVASKGALPLSELQVRFGVMREEVRKAALAPEAAPKMLG